MKVGPKSITDTQHMVTQVSLAHTNKHMHTHIHTPRLLLLVVTHCNDGDDADGVVVHCIVVVVVHST